METTQHPSNEPSDSFDSDPIALWRSAPLERSAAFSTVFGAISQAIQYTLRNELPPLFFSSLDSYANTRRALPLLVYAASNPSPRYHGREFTYDVLNPRMMGGFWWSAAKVLPTALATVETTLREAGQPELARAYSPRRHARILASVRRRKEFIDRILSAETSLVNDLINFSIAIRYARRPLAAHLRLMTSWGFTLRRIYPGLDASGLAPKLFRIATRTLAAAMPPDGDLPVAQAQTNLIPMPLRSAPKTPLEFPRLRNAA
jgi:hypothetical protein